MHVLLEEKPKYSRRTSNRRCELHIVPTTARLSCTETTHKRDCLTFGARSQWDLLALQRPSSPSGSNRGNRRPPPEVSQSKRPGGPGSQSPAGSRREPGRNTGDTRTTSLLDEGGGGRRELQGVREFSTGWGKYQYLPRRQLTVSCCPLWQCCRSSWGHTVGLRTSTTALCYTQTSLSHMKRWQLLCLTLQPWSGCNMNLLHCLQHRHEARCSFTLLFLQPPPAQRSLWILRFSCRGQTPEIVCSPVECAAEFGWRAAALTVWPTAVLECSEDHLDVLLSLHSVKGERLTGHRWHAAWLKSYVLHLRQNYLLDTDSITAPGYFEVRRENHLNLVLKTKIMNWRDECLSKKIYLKYH